MNYCYFGFNLVIDLWFLEKRIEQKNWSIKFLLKSRRVWRSNENKDDKSRIIFIKIRATNEFRTKMILWFSSKTPPPTLPSKFLLVKKKKKTFVARSTSELHTRIVFFLVYFFSWCFNVLLGWVSFGLSMYWACDKRLPEKSHLFLSFF